MIVKVKQCPNCLIDMVQESVLSHFDTPITIEHCETCGGLWVEAKELYKIKLDDSSGIKYIDEKILKNLGEGFTIKDEELKCPEDSTYLQKPLKLLFPESSVEVDMCYTCHGVWFNHGELLQYQEARSNFNKNEPENIVDGVNFKNEKTRHLVNNVLIQNNLPTYGVTKVTDGVIFKNKKTKDIINKMLAQPHNRHKRDTNKRIATFLTTPTNVSRHDTPQMLLNKLIRALMQAISNDRDYP